MKKGQEIYLEHFARLGLFGRVLALVGPLEEEEAKEKVILKQKKFANYFFIRSWVYPISTFPGIDNICFNFQKRKIKFNFKK